VTLVLRLGAAASLVALLGAAGPPPAARFVPGTYRQIDTVTKKALGVGNQIVIIAGKGGRFGFSVNAIRPTDENSGFVAGVLPAGPLPATWQKVSSSGNCRLLFESVPHGLKVSQDLTFGDCGFGYRVSASGTYALVPEKPLKT
jgi:hypothetical protein